MDDKISVIMACYNCEKTIRKSINSILAQTYENWVMICCDDGSSDNTLDILNEYKEKYPDKFVVISNGENKKLPYSLNHCLQYVETKLVARMDADDISTPDRFEKEVSFLKSHPDCDLVSTGVTVLDENDNRIGCIIKEYEPTKETIIRKNPFSHATVMTYKRVYDALGGYSLEPCAIRVEDYELWFRFMAAGFKGYNIPDELYAILEDEEAVKRRTFSGRLNGARMMKKGCKLLGYKGWVCYRSYIGVLKAFVPVSIYKVLHKAKLEKKKGNV